MKKLIIPLLFIALFSGCALITKVDPGEVTIDGKMTVKIDKAWNQLPERIRESSAHWTRDGILLDNLEFFVGVANGAKIGKQQSKNIKPITFLASMQGDQLVSLVESYYSRDESRFTLVKVEPTTFVGAKGVKVRFTLIRKEDDVKLSGIAWVVNRNKEFYAMFYTAPSLGFFPSSEAMVTQIAESAKAK